MTRFNTKPQYVVVEDYNVTLVTPCSGFVTILLPFVTLFPSKTTRCCGGKERKKEKNQKKERKKIYILHIIYIKRNTHHAINPNIYGEEADGKNPIPPHLLHPRLDRGSHLDHA
jgi:hypothetical protein